MLGLDSEHAKQLSLSLSGIRHESRYAKARTFVAPLIVTSILLLIFIVIGAILGIRSFSPSVAVTVSAMTIAFGITIAATLLVLLRAEIFAGLVAETEPHPAEAQEIREQPEADTGSSIQSKHSESPLERCERRLKRYDSILLPILLILVSGWVVYQSGYQIISGVWRSENSNFLLSAGMNLVVAFLCLIGSKWYALQDVEAIPETRAVAGILRAVQYTVLFAAVLLFIDNLGIYVLDEILGRAFLAIWVLVSVEQVVRASLYFLNPKRSWKEMEAPARLVLVDTLFAGKNPIAAFADLLDQRFGVNLRSSFVLEYSRRIAPRVAVGILLIFWLATALVSVDYYQVGVVSRFGRFPEGGLLAPGLHWKLPWPMESVRMVPVGRIQHITIGNESRDARPVLWAQAHAANEYRLLLGGGRDLVSIDAQALYRITDPVKYCFRLQNPEEALKALSYRALMRQTVGSTTEAVLSEDRANFSKKFRDAIQKEIDEDDFGIEVVQVVLRSIHPPVDVADAYQSVVSSQIERVTLATKAKVDSGKAIPAAQAAQYAAIVGARANAVGRLSAATGEATKFRSINAAYSVAPQLYRQRRWLETIEDAVANKPVYLIGGKSTDELWLDFRPNPAIGPTDQGSTTRSSTNSVPGGGD